MSGFNNLKARLNYRGGSNQQDRMIADKLASLKKSLLYSYQAAVVTIDGDDAPKFRALINPNKVTMELDDKVISIPYEDTSLAGGSSQRTNIHIGSVVYWTNTKTHWIVYSEQLEELAYFRGNMRQCESEPLYIGDDSTPYYYYLKGPDEKSIDWQKTKHFIFNDLNYNIEIYISKTEQTKQFFQRFTKLKLPFKNSIGEIEFRPYEVQAVDNISSDGLLTVYLKEDYTNEWAQESVQEPEAVTFSHREVPLAQIQGPSQVYPYDTATYTIAKPQCGTWALSNKRAVITSQNESSVTIEITTGKSGSVSLIYRVDGMEDIVFNIEILSL